jgi:hypothetical protein
MVRYRWYDAIAVPSRENIQLQEVLRMPDQPDTRDSEAAQQDQSDANTKRFAAQMQQDVRAWSAREADATDRAADATLLMAAKEAKAATTRKRTKAAPKPAAPVESSKGRPFSMSYEGVSNAQYIAGRIARGAR